MKRFMILILIAVVGYGIFYLIKRSMPYSDHSELSTTEMSIDSVWTLGPATALYDKTSRQFYWLKSYALLDQSTFDTLKHKKARIRYMKFLAGPLENRIFWMQVDSTIVFDQVVEKDKILNR